MRERERNVRETCERKRQIERGERERKGEDECTRKWRKIREMKRGKVDRRERMNGNCFPKTNTTL